MNDCAVPYVPALVIAGHFGAVYLHWARRPGLSIWPNVKSLFVCLWFYGWLAALAVNQGGLRVSADLRQSHSQRKLEWVFFLLLLFELQALVLYTYIA